MKVTQDVEAAIAHAVELWAEQTLPGKPAIYANAAYYSLVRKLQEITDQIQDETKP